MSSRALRVTRQIRSAPLPGDWADRAACRGMDTARFFPPKGFHVPDWFKELCGACPVVAYCRTYALRHPVGGLWAGMSEKERLVIRRRQREAS